MTKTKAYELFGKWWAEYIWLELNTYEFKKLTYKIQNDKEKGIQICPKKEDIFKAFRLCCINDVKVVIIGLEPYNNTLYDYTPVASGLTFGINTVLPAYVPPSLKNIIKEAENNLGKTAIDFDYTLESWSKQGVLLLNRALTVQENNTQSHIEQWKPFIKRVIEILDNYTSNTIFMFYGNEARELKQYLENKTFKFVNANCFKEVNNYLETPINWLEHYGE